MTRGKFIHGARFNRVVGMHRPRETRSVNEFRNWSVNRFPLHPVPRSIYCSRSPSNKIPTLPEFTTGWKLSRKSLPQSIEHLERAAQFPAKGLRKFKRLQPTVGQLLRRSPNFPAFPNQRHTTQLSLHSIKTRQTESSWAYSCFLRPYIYIYIFSFLIFQRITI